MRPPWPINLIALGLFLLGLWYGMYAGLVGWQALAAGAPTLGLSPPVEVVVLPYLLAGVYGATAMFCLITTLGLRRGGRWAAALAVLLVLAAFPGGAPLNLVGGLLVALLLILPPARRFYWRGR